MELKLLIAGVALFIVSLVMKHFKPKVQETRFVKIYNEAYEWIETGWSAVILAAFLMYFLVQAFKIPSGSMRMTLLEGDHLFVNKFIYGVHIPFSGGKRIFPMRQVQRGDIIIFKCPPVALSASERMERMDKDFIKRCIAIGGDTIEVKNKAVFVNGNRIQETYTNFVDESVYQTVKVFPTSAEYQRAWEQGSFVTIPSAVVRDNFGPVIVPPGHYFAMGDNRDRSFDSRFWGPLQDKYMKGRALVLYWPFSRVRLIKNIQRKA
jgi:signal peptidase I